MTRINDSAHYIQTSPANGDDNEFVDEVFVLDEVFGTTTLIPDIP